MTLSHLIFREITYRKLNFALSVLAVAIAALSIVASDWIVRRDTEVTRRILADKIAETEAAIDQKLQSVAAAGADLEDTIRKQMVGLGFNVLILPENQDVAELHLSGSLSQTMPEAYVQRLADSKIMTVNHLLPTVMKQVKWPEQNLDVVIYGTRGEVPLMHRDLKKPILAAVSPGQMVVGHSIHTKLGLDVGQEVDFMGKKFNVSKLHPERGSSDDVTIWIDLAQAQELLGLQNLVHAILALECECTGDRISEIRNEISSILPGTQVIERYSQALARAEARTKAKQVAEESLAAEKLAAESSLAREIQSRTRIQNEHRQLARVVLPLVLVLAASAVGLLAFINVRYRREEIGILRALGLRTRQILVVILGRSLISGIVGGVLGVCLGIAIGATLGPMFDSVDSSISVGLSEKIVGSPNFLVTLLATPLLAVALSMIASWLAAATAASQDAAIVLQGE
jgi:ABC-type lipoprotein release transport system permease subunit